MLIKYWGTEEDYELQGSPYDLCTVARDSKSTSDPER
jgi:hypothetical protein